jgi:hypothetical protein
MELVKSVRGRNIDTHMQLLITERKKKFNSFRTLRSGFDSGWAQKSSLCLDIGYYGVTMETSNSTNTNFL